MVGLDSGVLDVWSLGEEGGLGSSVLLDDDALLEGSQFHEVGLVLGGQALEGGDSLVDFGLQDFGKWVVFVGHGSLSDTVEGGLESLFLDLVSVSWVVDSLLHLFEGVSEDAS